MVNAVRSALYAAMILTVSGGAALAEGDLFVRQLELTPEQVALHAPRPDDPFALEQALSVSVMAAGNQRRLQAGLGSLSIDQGLSDAATRYSQKMRDLDFFAHDAPDGETLAQRLPEDQRYRFSRLGENLWAGEGALDWQAGVLAEQAADDWILSPSHRDNLLEPAYDVAGVGVAIGGDKVYVTMLYARPQIDAASARLGAIYSAAPADLYGLTRQVESEALSAINAERGTLALPALTNDFELSQEARSHAEAVLASGDFSNSSVEGEVVLRRVLNNPESGTSRLSMLIWQGSGAVVWQGQAIAGSAMKSWRDQGASMTDILDSTYNRAGIGVASDGSRVYLSVLLSETAPVMSQVLSRAEPLEMINLGDITTLTGGNFVTIE